MRAPWSARVRRGLRTLGIVAAGVLGARLAAACYDVPEPPCGFRCGPQGACPEHYVCNSNDGVCHHEDAPASLVCGTVDAGLPPDAP